MRFTSRALLISATLAGGTMLPGALAAQGRGGQGGPDNRPEVTFPVNIPPDDAKLQAMKKEAMRLVDSMSTFTQQMVDQVFSFGEPGFQEFETSAYLTGILEK
ncbi:MAG TPA: hypothetical protein VI259_09250, partial [Gemmatimonadaceae bacterium]